MRLTYRDLGCFDLATPYAVGDVIDAYFRVRENRIVHGALIHHHRTFRRNG